MAATLSTWTIDPVHSSVEFSLDYMGFSTYRTGFRALECVLENLDVAFDELVALPADRGVRDHASGLGRRSGAAAR